jgi:hypothetical protein
MNDLEKVDLEKEWPIGEERQRRILRGNICSTVALVLILIELWLNLLAHEGTGGPNKTLLGICIGLDVVAIGLSFVGISWSRRPPLEQPSIFSVVVAMIIFLLTFIELDIALG